MKQKDLEIERKFLIRFPDRSYLESAGDWTQIEQTYLLSPAEITARVRKRGKNDSWVYTHTAKTRISDCSRVEIEREIPESEYLELLKTADPAKRRIEKTRWCVPFRGNTLEIDLYPFWTDRAILEIELEDEQQEFSIPQEIRIIREVTSDSRYTNSNLAREIPLDPIK